MELTNELIISYMSGSQTNSLLNMEIVDTSKTATEFKPAPTYHNEQAIHSYGNSSKKLDDKNVKRMYSNQNPFALKDLNYWTKTDELNTAPYLRYFNTDITYYQNNVVVIIGEYILSGKPSSHTPEHGGMPDNMVWNLDNIPNTMMVAWYDDVSVQRNPFMVFENRQFSPYICKIETDTTERNKNVLINDSFRRHKRTKNNTSYWYVPELAHLNIRDTNLPIYDLVPSSTSVSDSRDPLKNQAYINITFEGINLTSIQDERLRFISEILGGHPSTDDVFSITEKMNTTTGTNGVINIMWDDKKFKNELGVSLKDGWTIYLYSTYMLKSDLGFTIAETNTMMSVYTIAFPTGTPLFSPSNSYVRGNITIDVNNGSINPDISYLRTTHNQDESNEVIAEVKHGDTLNFEKSFKKFRGKGIK